MGAFDIVAVVLVCAAFAGVCGRLIYRKVKHKGGCCGCDCASCGACGAHKADGGNVCPHCKGEKEGDSSRCSE